MKFGKESENIEFKKSTGQLSKSMDDIASILNKNGEGVLYFGIKPDGEVCGQEISEKTLNDVAETIKASIKPMIYPKIEEINIDKKNVIRVSFSGNEKPYSSYGRYFKRVFDRAEEMSSEELKETFASIDYTSSWENHKTPYGIEDIDHDALKRFYNQSVSCGRLDPLPRYDEAELLTALGLLIDNKLTNAGYYLFSSKGPVVLKAAIYSTDARINFNDIQRWKDNIYNLIDKGILYIKNNIKWRVESSGYAERIEIPEIPIDAIREIVVNSFAHANYRGESEHEIDITPTEIEIYNPGSFPINLTPESFVLKRRKSLPRNKVILEILYKCKNVEMFGSGFKKVYSLCKSENVEVKYDIDPYGFSFFFLRNSSDISSVNNEKESDDHLDEIYESVLSLIEKKPTLSSKEMSEKIGCSPRTIQRSLSTLKEKGKIKRVGTQRRGYWEIIKSSKRTSVDRKRC